jgi:hypothetical protein
MIHYRNSLLRTYNKGIQGYTAEMHENERETYINKFQQV